MPHCIVRIFESLLRRLLPAPGRHRACGVRPDPVPVDAPTLPVHGVDIGPRFIHGVAVA